MTFAARITLIEGRPPIAANDSRHPVDVLGPLYSKIAALPDYKRDEPIWLERNNYLAAEAAMRESLKVRGWALSRVKGFPFQNFILFNVIVSCKDIDGRSGNPGPDT